MAAGLALFTRFLCKISSSCRFHAFGVVHRTWSFGGLAPLPLIEACDVTENLGNFPRLLPLCGLEMSMFIRVYGTGTLDLV